MLPMASAVAFSLPPPWGEAAAPPLGELVCQELQVHWHELVSTCRFAAEVSIDSVAVLLFCNCQTVAAEVHFGCPCGLEGATLPRARPQQAENT